MARVLTSRSWTDPWAGRVTLLAAASFRKRDGDAEPAGTPPSPQRPTLTLQRFRHDDGLRAS